MDHQKNQFSQPLKQPEKEGGGGDPYRPPEDVHSGRLHGRFRVGGFVLLFRLRGEQGSPLDGRGSVIHLHLASRVLRFGHLQLRSVVGLLQAVVLPHALAGRLLRISEQADSLGAANVVPSGGKQEKGEVKCATRLFLWK